MAKVDEEGLVKKTKRRMKELLGGERTYLPKERKLVAKVPEIKAKPMKEITAKPELKTQRTVQVESGLKQAGLTEKEIARFRGKK